MFVSHPKKILGIPWKRKVVNLFFFTFVGALVGALMVSFVGTFVGALVGAFTGSNFVFCMFCACLINYNFLSKLIVPGTFSRLCGIDKSFT